jgi:hypothetical protein
MKEYGGVDVQTNSFLTSELVGGKWSATRPVCYTFKKKPRQPLDWVGPRVGGDDVQKWKFLILPEFQLRNLGHAARSYTDCTAPSIMTL